KMTEEQMKSLLATSIDWARKAKGSLLVTTSRRTGEKLTTLAREILGLSGVEHHFWHPDDPHHRDNPYFAYLASADAVVVTLDSVRMVREAASAGKPVYLAAIGKGLKSTKFTDRFLVLMQKLGYAAPWQGKLSLRKPRQPLNDTARVAGFVQAVWNRRYRK